MKTDKLTRYLGYTPQRIAIFRALKLGDLLCTVPAWRALRQAFPEAHIALISLPWATEFVARFPGLFDEFIEFPGWPGLPEQPVDARKTAGFLSAMQDRQWDVVLQMQGNGTLVNAMLALFGANAVAGYFPEHHPEQAIAPSPLRMAYPQQSHEIKRHIRLMQFLGLGEADPALEFPLSPPTPVSDALREFSPYVCIHAGGISGRRWPAVNFAAVADLLAGQGFRIVLTGTTAEQPVTEAVRLAMQHPAIDLTGKTDLGTLSAVLRGAQLLVSNDTGVAHLSVACQVPGVILFTSADPAEWGPLNRARHRVVREPDATPERVVTEALGLLRTVNP